jgi:hypothetical protein
VEGCPGREVGGELKGETRLSVVRLFLSLGLCLTGGRQGNSFLQVSNQLSIGDAWVALPVRETAGHLKWPAESIGCVNVERCGRTVVGYAVIAS